MKLEELRVYNQADILSDKIWNTIIDWDHFAKDTMGKQMARSVDSISANIAEGYGRYFYKENRNFCFYSRGSLLETKNWLGKSFRRGFLPKEEYDQLMTDLEDLHKSLNAYIKTIGKTANNE